MRNYVIINGINSLTIQGLAINNLPPITKPMIRTQREEIDGRDGDIVTELGYSAYDKQMEIGLYGNFDIDSIIKYFTGEGTIVFSNEADKYYNFKILDQIDYEKLLKFKTAVVTFHCQPFKYPLEEEPVEAEIKTITGTGESITLENVEEAPMKIVYKGNTSQDSTTGKNLYNDNFDDYTQPVNYRICPIDLEIGQTYTLKATLKGTSITGTVVAVVPYGEQYTDFSTQLKMAVDSQGYGHTLTFTPDSTWTSPKLAIYASNEETFDNLFTNYEIQLEKGSAATSYEPYTNGASPNPDYPQEIQVVSGDNTIRVEGEGKNLLDKSTISSGDITGSPTNIRYTTFQNLWLNAGTYTFSSNITSPFRYAIQGQKVSAPPVNPYPPLELNSGWLTSSTLEYTFTLTTGMWIDLCISKENNATLTLEEAKQFNYQLEVGNQATSYEPYTGASYPINLPVENLVEGIIEKENINSSGLLLIDNSFDLHIAKVTQGETYTITSNDINNGFVGGFFTSYPANNTYSYNNQRVVSNSWTFTAPITGYVAFRSQTGYQYAQLERGTKRNTYTPYGTTPIELCKIGTYQDKIDKSTGKNLLDYSKNNSASASYSINGNILTLTSNGAIYLEMDTTTGETYTLTYTKNNGFASVRASDYNNGGAWINYGVVTGTGKNHITFTANSNKAIIQMVGGTANSSYIVDLKASKGSAIDYDFEPYGTSWYLKKEIGKQNISSQWWNLYNASGQSPRRFGLSGTKWFANGLPLKCNCFIAGSYNSQVDLSIWTQTGYLAITDKNSKWESANDLITWLNNNDTILYYPLATPTYTLIEGELLNQLEAIKMSYEGQTNLSQTNNDLAFELDASVTFLTPMEINNIGNIYAKPILTIEGTGNIGVVLNGIQILEIDLSNNGKITIDVPKLEAYNPDDDSLLNRLVTGDYMKLLINEGDNKITFTGEVSGATLTNYIRWI